MDRDDIGGITDGSVRFRLEIRQQPQNARESSEVLVDRRVINPPPIVQVVIESSRLSEDSIREYLHFKYQMVAEILDETGVEDMSKYDAKEGRPGRRMVGKRVLAMSITAKDDDDNLGCFFIFEDISVRVIGVYRLKFSLLMIDPSRFEQQRHVPFLASIVSNSFTVYKPKDFPGMSPNSPLTIRLRQAAEFWVQIRNTRRAPQTTGPKVSVKEQNDDDTDGD